MPLLGGFIIPAGGGSVGCTSFFPWPRDANNNRRPSRRTIALHESIQARFVWWSAAPVPHFRRVSCWGTLLAVIESRGRLPAMLPLSDSTGRHVYMDVVRKLGYNSVTCRLP